MKATLAKDIISSSRIIIFATALFCLVSGCGRIASIILGGIGGSSSPTYSIGGTISKLSGTIVLNNNSGNSLSVSASGAFTFSTRLLTATTYSVTVATQPTGQYCRVSSGLGIVAGANITNVMINCQISGQANFAKTTTTPSTADSYFQATATDSSGNVYTVGYKSDSSLTGFGNGVSATGFFNGFNALVVKYNSSGVAQWAQSTAISGTAGTYFKGVATDSSGNVYAVGYKDDNGAVGFGNNVFAAGFFAGRNVLVVKYNSSGVAQWAQTTSVSGTADSIFNGVATDSFGNVYAVGYIDDNGAVGFGNSVSTSGFFAGRNVLVVKYDSSGGAQWAQSNSVSGTGNSAFEGVATDPTGNVYGVGFKFSGALGFGNGVSVTGIYAGINILLVKYNSSGLAQWAQSTAVSGMAYSVFNGVATDASGNIYAVGNNGDNTALGFGNGVFSTGFYNGDNVLIVKYNSSGAAQWAQSTAVSGTGNSYFNGVTTDSSGNVYAVGNNGDNAATGFGSGVFSTGFYNGDNALIVKYNSSGLAQWAQSTAVSGTGDSYFYGVTTNSSGNVYAVGNNGDNAATGFGNDVSATGSFNGRNILMVNYTQ
jgi:hypothetical protein